MKPSIIFFLTFVVLVSLPRPAQPVRKDTRLILDQLQQLERVIKDMEAKIDTISLKRAQWLKR